MEIWSFTKEPRKRAQSYQHLDQIITDYYSLWYWLFFQSYQFITGLAYSIETNNTLTPTHKLEWPVNQTCMSVDWSWYTRREAHRHSAQKGPAPNAPESNSGPPCCEATSLTQRETVYDCFEEEIQTLNLNIYNKQTNKLFTEENKVLEHCLKLEKWQGPPHINRVKHYRLSSFKVSLFIQFIQPRKQKELVYSFL